MNLITRAILLLLIVLSSAFGSFSKGISKIDSLENLLKKSSKNSNKVNLLCQLAEEYQSSNKEKSLELFNDALALSINLNDKKNETTCLNLLSKFYLSSDLDKSIELAKQALDLATSNGNRKEEAEAYKNMGGFYFKNNNYDAAIDNYKKALSIKESISDKKGCADLEYNVGYTYSKLGNNNQTIDFYLKALDKYQKLDDKKEVASMFVKIGNIYYYSGDYNTAVNYYKNSLITAEKLKDTLRVGNSYQMLGVIYHEWGNYDKAIEYYKESQNNFEKLKYKRGIANNYINIGLVYQSMNKSKERIKNKINDKTWKYNTNKALEYFQNAHILMKEYGEAKDVRNTLYSLGQVFDNLEEYKKAIACYDTAITSARNSGDKRDLSSMLFSKGLSYYKLKKYDLSEKNLLEALSISVEISNKITIAQITLNLGLLYIHKGQFEVALKNLNQSLNIIREINAKDYLGQVYEGFSDAYSAMGNYKQAIEYYKSYISLRDSMLNEQTLHLITEVETKYKTEKKEKEIKLLNTSNALKENQIKQQRLILWVFVAGFLIIIVFSVLLYRQFNAKKKANEILKKQQEEILMKNEELHQQKEEIQAQAELLEQTNHELEKLSVVASKTDNAVIIADSTGEIEWVNDGFTRVFGYTLEEFKTTKGSNLISISSNFNFSEDLKKSIHEKKSVTYVSCAASKSGEAVWLQTTLTPIFDSTGVFNKIIAIDSDITKIKLTEQELEKQRDIALKQRDLISEQKQEITDSINYAKQIQTAVMPTIEIIASRISDFFILFKPRDIVSGDFYWATVKGNKLIVAAVDCTGHGVPGAFMSMLGIAFLNEIVNKSYDLKQDAFKASEILDQLRDRVITSLHQTGRMGEAQDGMDMTLCIIDNDKKELQYSGANNPLYLIRNDSLQVFKGDKMPIGIHSRTNSFTNNIISLEKGDAIYIFSDGYADQFGGEKIKKFKYKTFQQMLLEIQHRSMSIQKEIIESRLDDWMGNNEQVDDIVVIGLKV